MPWSQTDAIQHTKKANTPSEQSKWAKVANSVLKTTGDDAKAVRTANSVISRDQFNR